MEVLQALDRTVSSEGQTLDSLNSGSNAAKVLGLWWKPGEDIFTFSLSLLQTQRNVLPGTEAPTKREPFLVF